MLKNSNESINILSKEEKKEKLFFINKNKVVSMPLNGHWNNDSGCKVD